MSYSEKEKQIWKAKMQRIAKKIKAMDEHELKTFVAKSPVFTCEGHILSLRNQACLLMQCAFDAIQPTQIGGFRQWQKIGRRVIKGQHSIGSIMVPIGIVKDSDGNEDDSDIRFRWVPVFDVTQTEEIQDATEAAESVSGGLFAA